MAKIYHIWSSKAKCSYVFMEDKHEKYFFVLPCSLNNKSITSPNQKNFSLSRENFSPSGELIQHGEFFPIREKYRTACRK